MYPLVLSQMQYVFQERATYVTGVVFLGARTCLRGPELEHSYKITLFRRGFLCSIPTTRAGSISVAATAIGPGPALRAKAIPRLHWAGCPPAACHARGVVSTVLTRTKPRAPPPGAAGTQDRCGERPVTGAHVSQKAGRSAPSCSLSSPAGPEGAPGKPA